MEFTKSFKHTQIIKFLFIALIGSIILAISSKIKIPFYPVPMTMQTLIVLMIGIGFGWKLGVATVALYLFEGIIGLPVFSGSPEKGVGLVYFTGPTMGYLLGFLVTVYISGKFIYDNNIVKNFLKIIFCYKLYIYSRDGLVRYFNWLGQTNFSIGCSTFFVS